MSKQITRLATGTLSYSEPPTLLENFIKVDFKTALSFVFKIIIFTFLFGNPSIIFSNVPTDPVTKNVNENYSSVFSKPLLSEFAAPEIDVWYGDVQSFGSEGQPQVWCNILGNVSDDGSISSLSYTLNGGTSVSLSIGPDGRRLLSSGDFNIDLAATDLNPGSNTVIITAVDNNANVKEKIITVNYSSGNVWPNPFAVDWSTLSGDITQISDLAHVVDGKFYIDADKIRTEEPGYDRLIALGDITWTNYEVLVPITIHSMPGGGGVGVLFRWNGHTNSPVTCPQPQCGWLPVGDIAWYRPGKLEFYEGIEVSRTLNTGTTYLFRTSVETLNNGNTNYKLKVWEEGTTEPSPWDLEQTIGTSDEQDGSFLLISHKADVTFGNVTVSPGAMSISNIQTQLSNGNTEATISWTTNIPASSRVDYGSTQGYELGFVENSTEVTDHSITLTGLSPSSIYNYEITSVSSSMETVESGNLLLATSQSGIVSDDFCSGTLNSIWTFDDPLSDANYTLTGAGTNDAWLEISVPAGSDHQIFTSGIEAPNMLQSMNDADFEVEVKFESPVVAPQYQEQGILVKESASTFLRFEFFSKNGNVTQIYARHFDPTSSNTYNDEAIGTGLSAPIYMRVKRVGNVWTQSYSTDGSAWIDMPSFNYTMAPTAIGPYAGNAVGSTSPAHTGKFDYFENIEEPITSEDACVLQNPILSAIGNQEADEGSSGLNVNITATDPDGNDADLVFSASGLPPNAQLVNNNDGTATLQLNPMFGDAGTYEVTVTVTDMAALTDSETFYIYISAPGTGPSNIFSDDFCEGPLNSNWTFAAPNGGTMNFDASLTDGWWQANVPSGSSHELWEQGIQVPHIIQDANNTDFEVKVKLLSPVVAPQFQEQGILIKGTDFHFLRFELYSNNSNTKALGAVLGSAASTGIPISSSVEFNTTVGALGIAPVYLRLKRTGNVWELFTSLDDNTWSFVGSFTHTIEVTGIGIYGGNAGNNPAHMAQFDYFENLASQIVDEDICLSIPTPVEMVSFNAQLIDKASMLIWTTASEINNDRFDVQHSVDSRDFRTIGTVPGAGNTQTPEDYKFVHLQPRNGVNYYRLKQIDENGTFSYSPIRSVNVVFENDYLLFPNPAKATINLLVSHSLINTTVEVYDVNGRIILSRLVDSTVNSFSVEDWPAGIYLVRINTPGDSRIKRFVKE